MPRRALIRRRTALSGGLLLMGAMLVRCSLFVDTDGLSGDSGANLLDGSTSDVAIREASGDGISGDAAIATDAGFPGCDGGNVVCDDFESDSFSDRWNSSNIYGGGVAEFVDDASVSPTHSFHSNIPANDSGAGAALYQNVVLGATSIHCQLDVLIRPSTPNSWQAIGLAFAGDDAGTAYYYTAVNVGQAETQIYRVTGYVDGGSDYDEQDVSPIASGVWTPIAIDMNPSGANEMVTVTIGSAAPMTRAFGAPPGATLTQIQLSQDYSLTAVDMLVDNVLCDVVP